MEWVLNAKGVFYRSQIRASSPLNVLASWNGHSQSHGFIVYVGFSSIFFLPEYPPYIQHDTEIGEAE